MWKSFNRINIEKDEIFLLQWSPNETWKTYFSVKGVSKNSDPDPLERFLCFFSSFLFFFLVSFFFSVTEVFNSKDTQLHRDRFEMNLIQEIDKTNTRSREDFSSLELKQWWSSTSQWRAQKVSRLLHTRKIGVRVNTRLWK